MPVIVRWPNLKRYKISLVKGGMISKIGSAKKLWYRSIQIDDVTQVESWKHSACVPYVIKKDKDLAIAVSLTIEKQATRKRE